MTKPKIDAAILELMASRICHDLVSPVGAVHNGIEFLEDGGKDALDDALALISYSAGQAAAKLQSFRMAYGAGGNDSNLTAEDARKCFSDLIAADGKIALSWKLGPMMSKPPAYCKVLMCALILATECLPRGGSVSAAPESGATVITVEGRDAGPRPMAQDAMALKIAADRLEPKLVHPYVTGLLAQLNGYTIAFTAVEPDKASIRLVHPAA